MKLSEAVGPYLTFCQAERLNSSQTLAKYKDCFRAWIVPALGEKELESIDRVTILGLKKAMVDKGIQASRQYSIVMTLKSFLRFCIEVLKIETLSPKEISLPDRGKPHVLVLTQEEVQRLYSNIDLHTFTGIRLRALIELLLATGMRISEALSLNREPFDNGVMELEIIGKGSRPRTVFFNERCTFWVRQYLNKRYDDNLALFVTTGFQPGRLKRDDISRFFINLRAKAGIAKKITPHVLRHTYCTNLLNHGADITFIKELAGHQDIQTTAKYYLGVDKKQLRRVVDKYLKYEDVEDNRFIDRPA